jgi:hypothetical protein
LHVLHCQHGEHLGEPVERVSRFKGSRACAGIVAGASPRRVILEIGKAYLRHGHETGNYATRRFFEMPLKVLWLCDVFV